MSANHNNGKADDDKIQGQIEFIVNQQAQFGVGLAKLEQQSAKLQQQIAETNANIVQLAEVTLNITSVVEKQEQQIAELITHSKKTDEQMRVTDERLRNTDEKLNVLISVVELMLGGTKGNLPSKE